MEAGQESAGECPYPDPCDGEAHPPRARLSSQQAEEDNEDGSGAGRGIVRRMGGVKDRLSSEGG